MCVSLLTCRRWHMIHALNGSSLSQDLQNWSVNLSASSSPEELTRSGSLHSWALIAGLTPCSKLLYGHLQEEDLFSEASRYTTLHLLSCLLLRCWKCVYTFKNIHYTDYFKNRVESGIGTSRLVWLVWQQLAHNNRIQPYVNTCVREAGGKDGSEGDFSVTLSEAAVLLSVSRTIKWSSHKRTSTPLKCFVIRWLHNHILITWCQPGITMSAETKIVQQELESWQ